MSKRCTEPSLDELLADCATRLLMKSDGVEEVALRRLLGSIGTARAEGRDQLPQDPLASMPRITAMGARPMDWTCRQ
jgi:hypothetical protein